MKKTHLFHLVNNSVWPFFVAFGGFFLVSGLGFFMHRIPYGFFFLSFGFIFLLICAYYWFNEVIKEAVIEGYHTKVVRIGLKNGFYLFLTSEIMLFFGFFWAFFHSSICPAVEIGHHWPPYGIFIIKTWHYPFYNTLLLIISGFAVTWTHQAMALGNFKNCIDGVLTAIFLGLIFIILQSIEYYEADYSIIDGVYGSVFYMLTGLHGSHVIIGIIFLIICFLRLISNHFTTQHYMGLIFAIWYWHFVDIIWIIVFLTVYFWGNW